MMDQERPAIALLTDFGTRDVYAGIVKGVLASRAPEARVIELTHDVPPGDIRTAALLLWQAQEFMPTGTVFLAVVDPSVGTGRRAVAMRLPKGHGVGPDNGLFSFLFPPGRIPQAVTLDVARLSMPGTSTTFHGRDVFAPAAARLATGAALTDLGSPAGSLVTLSTPRIDLSEGRATGEVLRFDTFGNAITSLGTLRAAGTSVELTPCWQAMAPMAFEATAARVRIGSHLQLPLSSTYADVPPGQPLAYIGSSGLLEIGVYGGRADELLGLSRGIQVTLVDEG